MPRQHFNFQTAKTIKMPLDRMWETISDFHDLSWCPSVVSTCEPEGDFAGDHVGARRKVNGEYVEVLRSIDNTNHTFRYAIEDGPSPLSREETAGFTADINLKSVQDGWTQIEVTANWISETSNASQYCEKTYVGMFNDLQKLAKQAA